MAVVIPLAASVLFSEQIRAFFPGDIGALVVASPWVGVVSFYVFGFVGGFFKNDPFEQIAPRVWWSLGVVMLVNFVFNLPDIENALSVMVWFVAYAALPVMHWRLKKNPKALIVPVMAIWTAVNLWVGATLVMEAGGSLAELKLGLWSFWGIGCAWLGGTIRQLGIAFAALAEGKQSIRPRGPTGPHGDANWAYDPEEMSGGEIETEEW